MAALAADLFDEMDFLEAHALVDSLAHVVDRQQGHGYARQSFHLDACLAVAFNGAAAFEFTSVVVEDEFDAAFSQIEDMAERDEVTRPLGPHDTGNAGYTENIAFFHSTGFDSFIALAAHGNAAAGNGSPGRHGFATDVDHDGVAVGVNVCKRIHRNHLLSKATVREGADWTVEAQTAFPEAGQVIGCHRDVSHE